MLISFILLTGYWLLCFWLGDPSDPYSMKGFFGNEVDQAILGTPHLYRGEGVPFDPVDRSRKLDILRRAERYLFRYILHQ